MVVGNDERTTDAQSFWVPVMEKGRLTAVGVVIESVPLKATVQGVGQWALYGDCLLAKSLMLDKPHTVRVCESISIVNVNWLGSKGQWTELLKHHM